MGLTRRQFVKLNAALAASLATANAWSTGSLIRKTIPSSGEQVTAMGIGTNRYGVTSDEDKAVLQDTLARFAELGGSIIDTAPSYGRGRSEVVLGEIAGAAGLSRQLFWATKVDARVPGPEQLEASLRKLGVDQADLIQVHNLRETAAQLPFLREAREEGLLRYIGVTTHRPTQHQDIEQLLKTEKLDFIQVNYSLADRSAADRLLPAAQEHGAAVLVNIPFARGRLFEMVGDRPLPDWAAEFDCRSWGNFFLKYIISHPAVTSPIPGTRKVRHAVDNMRAATGRLPSPELRQRQEALIDSL